VESQVVVAESYFKRGRMEWDWDTEEGESAGRFYSFHRTVGDFVNLLFGAGFVVEALHEPEPPAKTDLWGADHAQYTQVPATIIWRARANR
jgi:hypothetical protein